MPMKHLIWALGRWNRRIGRSGPSQATWQLEASLGYVGDRRICPTRLHVSFFSYFLKSSPSPVTSSPLGHLSACTLIGFHDISESLLSSGSKPQNEVDGSRILLVEYWWTTKVFHRNAPFYMPNSNTQAFSASVLVNTLQFNNPHCYFKTGFLFLRKHTLEKPETAIFITFIIFLDWFKQQRITVGFNCCLLLSTLREI